MISHQIETVFIAPLEQIVIAVNKLQKSAGSYLDARVPGYRQALVALAQIDEIVLIVHQVVDGREVASIVDDDDFALFGIERELQDAFQAEFQIF